MSDLSSVPTDELLTNLRKSETDVCACLVVMGLTGDTAAVRDRYEGNKRTVYEIEGELMRREITFTRAQTTG